MDNKRIDFAELKKLRDLVYGLSPDAWNNYHHAVMSQADQLIVLAERQHNRDTHIGTHSPEYYTFGWRHYDCALREIKRLQKDVLDLMEANKHG